MSKKQATTTPRILEDLSAQKPAQPVIADNDPNLPDAQEAAATAEINEQVALPNSVVKRAYKLRYKERARERGDKGKAAKRSRWDWLAQELAAATLTKDAKLKVDAFIDLLEANGIEKPLERWPSQTPGWEGRLRMTGRLALQKIVAETGILRFADGEWKEAPADWVAHFLN